MAFEAAQNPNRGKVDVLTKNEAKEALTRSLRVFTRVYLPIIRRFLMPTAVIPNTTPLHIRPLIAQTALYLFLCVQNALSHAGTGAGGGFPSGGRGKEGRPEGEGAALEGPGLVYGTAVFPEDAVVVGLFL
jgi:hypothetical protein